MMVASGCGPTMTLLPSHIPDRALGATDRGAASGDETLDLVIGLKLRDPGNAGAAVGAPALTASEFAERFGVAASDYNAVVAWAAAHDLEVVRTAAGRSTLTVRGTVAAIERAFGTSLHMYEDDLGTFRAPTAEPRLDPAMAEVVSGVVGLDDARRWLSHRLELPNTQPNSANSPTDLRSLYNVKTTYQGQGETVAILGTGGPPDPVVDVLLFAQKYAGLTALATQQYSQVFVGGPNRDPAKVASGEYGENTLDIDMVLAIAPKATIVHVFTATNAPGLFTDGISYVVNNLPQAHAVTVSFGSCERGAASEMPVINALLKQAKAQGQQWFFASGDAGTDGCQDGAGNKIISAGWPASSPFAVGVGGEQLASDGSEQAWGEKGGGGGGGGPSESFDKPAYQMGVTPDDGARDEPDVVALAGYPGVMQIANGKLTGSAGTSAAAPMWAAMWALIDQSQGGKGLPTGLENLYKLAGAGTGFRDITAGTNGDGTTPGFPAVAGFDLATGWGAPNLTTLIAGWNN
jgi:kumamolisin